MCVAMGKNRKYHQEKRKSKQTTRRSWVAQGIESAWGKSLNKQLKVRYNMGKIWVANSIIAFYWSFTDITRQPFRLEFIYSTFIIILIICAFILHLINWMALTLSFSLNIFIFICCTGNAMWKKDATNEITIYFG